MPLLSDAAMIKAVERGSGRSAAVVHGEMKRGLNSLATIASTAPWVGLFGTILGIANSFPGCSGERSTCMAAIAERLSESFVPTALGLLVAIPALWCYKYLRTELGAFDIEMENVSVGLVNYRAIHLGRRSRFQA
jgi:biopolymer transport protein ExbB/TolQ